MLGLKLTERDLRRVDVGTGALSALDLDRNPDGLLDGLIVRLEHLLRSGVIAFCIFLEELGRWGVTRGLSTHFSS